MHRVTLPTELLFMIIAESDDVQPLLLVCKRTLAFAERMLYRRIILLDGMVRTIKFHRALAAKPHRALYILSYSGPAYHQTLSAYSRLLAYTFPLMQNLVELDIPSIRAAELVLKGAKFPCLKTVRMKDVQWPHLANTFVRRQRALRQVWLERLPRDDSDGMWDHIITQHPHSEWLKADQISNRIRHVVVSPVVGQVYGPYRSPYLRSLTLDLGHDAWLYLPAICATIIRAVGDQQPNPLQILRFIHPLIREQDYLASDVLASVLAKATSITRLEIVIPAVVETFYTEWLETLWPAISKSLPNLLHLRISIPSTDVDGLPHNIRHPSLQCDTRVRFVTFSTHEVHGPPAIAGFGRHLSPKCRCPRSMAIRFGQTWYASRKQIMDRVVQSKADCGLDHDAWDRGDGQLHEVSEEARKKCEEDSKEWEIFLNDERMCVFAEDWDQV